ncbi:hypothetical protein [Ideonella sp. YS5]|uniref:hypothetical protein n=1 Tax=Ideonella sp. YS5 TaxID=3453714 RepID=UPI003F71B660
MAIGAVAAMAMSGCEPMSRQVSTRQVEQLAARCQDAMLREACVAQKDRSGLLQQRGAAPAASQVFVAGVGAIDAGAYNDIRTAGEAMCGMVKAKCSADWEGGACKTARSLWPSSAQRAPAG